jgi:hypothetical protein
MSGLRISEALALTDKLVAIHGQAAVLTLHGSVRVTVLYQQYQLASVCYEELSLCRNCKAVDVSDQSNLLVRIRAESIA